MKDKKIIIAGGTGFIGGELIKYFGNDNQIVILTRNLKDAVNNAFGNTRLQNVKAVIWNGKDVGEWWQELEGSDLVINLAGKSVNCRYTEKNKKEIFDSRVNATKALGEAIRKCINPPKLWINAASATIYRNAYDRPQDEFTGEIENDFSVQVCKLWEKTFLAEETEKTRKVALRMAITLGTGGVMVPYLNLCKFALGGKQGSGKQMFSWIHIEDVCRAIDYFFDNKQLSDVYNLSSPNPITNKVFMSSLRKVTNNGIGLPAQKWMLRLGATMIGTEAELLLKSRWVVPTKLTQAGFKFKHPEIEEAFESIIKAMPRKAYHLF